MSVVWYSAFHESKRRGNATNALTLSRIWGKLHFTCEFPHPMDSRSRKPLESTELLNGRLCVCICLTKPMDLSYLAAVLPASKQELVWWSCFSLLTLLAFKILLHSEAEDAIEFSVSVPEACRSGWKGKQLDNPSIKVRHLYQFLAGKDSLLTRTC
jgi:hypothetical protein